MHQFTRREWLKIAAVAPAAFTAVPLAASAAPSSDDVKAVVDKALGFFKTAQKDDGNFAPRAGEPGLTALIAAALIRAGVPSDNPVVAKALKYLESKVQKDGGVYIQGLSNYMTCLAIMTFKEANAGGKYDKTIESAAKYVKSLQFADGLNDKDPSFGGAGYDKPTGKGARPDLSNTHFMVEALLAAGVSKDDPTIKRALVYISRSQNVADEEFNALPYAAKASADDKGGFVYNLSDANNDKSPKRTADGGLRSEGGMSYAGLKSFLYAGVSKDDKRVKAAIDWVRRHYTVTENPGQKDAGLYYYYHTFAKAMDAIGENPFVDAKGVKHDWKQELFDELKKKQKDNGSWANTNGAFLENLPELATAFAVLAISYTKK